MASHIKWLDKDHAQLSNYYIPEKMQRSKINVVYFIAEWDDLKQVYKYDQKKSYSTVYMIKGWNTVDLASNCFIVYSSTKFYKVPILKALFGF